MRFLEFKPLTESATGPLQVPVQGFNRSQQVTALQQTLSQFKYDVHPTGILDDRTKTAIAQAQKDLGMPITGNPDSSFISAVNTAIHGVPGMLDYVSDVFNNIRNAASAVAPAATAAVSNAVSSAGNVVSNAVSAVTEPFNSNNNASSSKGRAVIIGNEKRTGGSISWRTNNPGNVQYGSKAKRYGAIGSIKAADGEPVAIMPTLDHGWKLQTDLWRSPTYNNGTINQGCRIWAVGVRKYKGISPYTIALADAAGASVHTKVSELSDAQLKNMVKQQAKLEGFKVGTVTTV